MAWYSVYSEPPIPAMLKKMLVISEGLHFSASWIAVPVGIAMFAAMFYLMVMGRRVSKSDKNGRSDNSGSVMSAALDEPKTTICAYQWFHDIADSQANSIRDRVEVLKVAVWGDKLVEALPSVKCGLLIRNNSVFPISIEKGIVQDMFFEGVRLAEKKLLLQNDVQRLGPSQEGQLIFEQRLSGPEANLIKNSPSGKFHFQGLVIEIKAAVHVPEVKPQRLLISEQNWAKLGEIRGKDSTEVDKLRDEIKSLRSRVAASVPKALEGDLVIDYAGYGADDIWQPVTSILRSLKEADNRIRLTDNYNTLFRIDPKPGVHKSLRVDYTFNGQPLSITVPENMKLTLPIEG
jgi:hypothetical protein